MTVAPDLLPPEPTTRPTSRLDVADWAVLAVLAAVTLALFGTGVHNGFVRYDDPLYLTRNAQVRAGLTWAGLRYAATAVVSSNWHPLTLVAEMSAVQMFGVSAPAFHLLSDVLHSANACLLYLFLRLATGRTWRAAAVAALWGWHPLRVESVAWVGELKDVLCGLFWMATLLAFLAYRRRPTAGRYLLVVAGMVAACLSKPMAVSLPLALLLVAVWPLGVDGREPAPGGWWRRRALEQVPLLLIAAAVAAVAVWTQSRTGATGSLAKFPVGIRLANAADAYRAYLVDTVWPTGLSMFYPHPALVGRSVPFAHWAAGLALLAAGTALAVGVRHRAPYAAVGWFWFVVSLIPVIGLVQVGYAARADRYTYLPSIGLTVALVWASADVLTAWLPRAAGSALGWAAGLAAAGALATVAGVDVRFWRDDLTLARRGAAVVPDDFLSLSSLAMADVTANRPAEAVALGRSAVELAPTVAETHHAYAQALQEAGQDGRALEEFQAAINLDPDHPYVRNDAGQLLREMGHDAEAEKQFRRAIALEPDLFDARLNLGVLLAAHRDYAGAVAQFRRAVELNPQLGSAHGDLGNALRLTGDNAGALEHDRLAVHLGDPRPETRAELAQLVAYNPDSTPADLAAVTPSAKQACDDPRFGRQPQPWYYYSVLLARQDRFDDAVAAAQRSLDLALANGPKGMVPAIRRQLAAYHLGRASPPPATTGVTTAPAAPAPGQ